MHRFTQFLKLSIVTFFVTFGYVLIGGGPVSAAEITPNPTSYSYGSTSEISPSSTITNSPSQSSLASTGDPANIIKIAAVVLILVGVGFGTRAILKKHKA